MEVIDTNMYNKSKAYVFYSYYRIEPYELMFPVELYETIQEQIVPNELDIPNESNEPNESNKSESSLIGINNEWPINLLNLSTRELNKFIIKNNLSPEQIISLKKSRRRMKNCIYARASRKKKICK